jgi:group I intron endonuclease
MSCKTGIYKLINKITEDFYIGPASRIGKSNSLSGFYVRFDKHKRQLNNNSHYNRFLQNSWNKYGEKNFEFEILATCPPEYCIKLEQWFLDNLKPTFNIRKIADSNLGIKFTEEHKNKIRIGNLKENNPEKGLKISKSKTGVKRADWVKEKLSRVKTGLPKLEAGRISNRDKRRLCSNITKLSLNDVKSIKLDLFNKVKSVDLANKYKVSFSCIMDIKHNRTFKDIII